MSVCQCHGMGTAGGSLHLLEGCCLCPVLVATDQAAPKAGGLNLLMCCRYSISRGSSDMWYLSLCSSTEMIFESKVQKRLRPTFPLQGGKRDISGDATRVEPQR